MLFGSCLLLQFLFFSKYTTPKQNLRVDILLTVLSMLLTSFVNDMLVILSFHETFSVFYFIIILLTAIGEDISGWCLQTYCSSAPFLRFSSPLTLFCTLPAILFPSHPLLHPSCDSLPLSPSSAPFLRFSSPLTLCTCFFLVCHRTLKKISPEFSAGKYT